jgi:hypothetical protein
LSFETATTTSQLVTHVPTGAGTYTITDLTTGTPYYIRVSSVNALGQGPATAVQTATPLEPSDAPAPSLLQLLDPLQHNSTDDVSTSLNLTWLPPQQTAATVGSGGVPVLEYLIETSTASYSDYTSAVQAVTDSCASGSSGLLRFSLDTTAVATAAIRGAYSSYAIRAASTTAEVQLALESLQNIGTVIVVADAGGFGTSGGQWLVTFTSEIGPLPELTLDTSLLQCGDSSAAVAPTVATTTAGALPLNADYKMLTAAAADSSKVLTGLLPGTVYYARVSTRTVLGHGARAYALPHGAGAVGSGCQVPYLQLDDELSSAAAATGTGTGESTIEATVTLPTQCALLQVSILST